jgi:hypothetical protein
VALFTWLVAGRLPEEVPEGTGMTMSQLKIACAQYREVSAIALRQHVDNYRLLEKSGVLVLSYNDRTSVVNVHAKNYAKYISDGGRMIGTVSIKELKKALKEKLEIDVDKDDFPEHNIVNSFGMSHVKINLYKGIYGIMNVKVNPKPSK